MVGATYSDVGTVTEADLLDRLGQHEAAQSLYLRVYDQYQDAPRSPRSTSGEAKRTGQSTLAIRRQPWSRSCFHTALESFTLATRKDAPKDGILVRYVTPRGASIGLRANDVFRGGGRRSSPEHGPVQARLASRR